MNVLSVLGPVDQDPEVSRRAACELFSPDTFCRVQEPPPPRDPPDLSGFGALMNLLVWLGLAVLIGVGIWLIVRAVMNRRPRDRDDEVDDDVLEEVGDVIIDVIIDHSREPRSWRDEADEHAAAGRIRDALRCRYRALVGDLARRGLLDEIPGRTTGEERDQLVVSAPEAADQFDAAADLFDDAWYGDAPVDRGDLDRFVGWETDVLAAAPAPAVRRSLIGISR
jgi:hypothetical protein